MIALLVAGLAAPPLIYPLEDHPRVTSTFGTYRISHHHAGLDLATDGDESVVVRAAAAGDIYRVRRNDAGFGRALYLRHPDGTQTVYAHLSAFAPKIAAEVRAREKDAFKIVFNPRPIPVAQGERLGWVGTSGTDLVHLHFELRRKGQPINPLVNGLTIPDTQAPRVVHLLAVPRGIRSHVNGGHDEVVVPVPADGRVVQPVRVQGDVVLYAEVQDRVDGSPRELTPYRVELHVDGRLWHATRYDQTSYGDMRHTELDFHLERQAEKTGRYNALFRGPARVRAHLKGGRSLRRLKRGRHPARILTWDAAGNRGEARFVIDVGPAEAPCAVENTGLTGGRRDRTPPPRLWRGRLLMIPTPDLCAGSHRVDLRINGVRQRRDLVVSRIGGAPALVTRVPAEEDAIIDLRLAPVGGAPDAWRFSSKAIKADAAIEVDGLQVEVEGDGLFFPYPTEIVPSENPGGPGLEALGPLYRMSNRYLPGRGFHRVGIRRPPGARHVGVYLHGGDRWWLLGGRDEATHTVGASVHMAHVALMSDTRPPVVGEPRVDAHPAGARLILPVSDVGAGISEVSLLVDGRPVPVERQRAFDRVIWMPWEPPGPGPHRLEVEARDRSGRVTKATRTILWPDG